MPVVLNLPRPPDAIRRDTGAAPSSGGGHRADAPALRG
jgi:hypothetical protein